MQASELVAGATVTPIQDTTDFMCGEGTTGTGGGACSQSATWSIVDDYDDYGEVWYACDDHLAAEVRKTLRRE